jgi:hypothetical protein
MDVAAAIAVDVHSSPTESSAPADVADASHELHQLHDPHGSPASLPRKNPPTAGILRTSKEKRAGHSPRVSIVESAPNNVHADLRDPPTATHRDTSASRHSAASSYQQQQQALRSPTTITTPRLIERMEEYALVEVADRTTIAVYYGSDGNDRASAGAVVTTSATHFMQGDSGGRFMQQQRQQETVYDRKGQDMMMTDMSGGGASMRAHGGATLQAPVRATMDRTSWNRVEVPTSLLSPNGVGGNGPYAAADGTSMLEHRQGLSSDHAAK